jgi:hypothetical protein
MRKSGVSTKPKIGDTVQTPEHRGVVDWIGSAQFAFTDEEAVVIKQGGETSKGHRVMVLFSNREWKVVERRKLSRAEVKAAIKSKKQRQRERVPHRRKRRDQAAGDSDE